MVGKNEVFPSGQSGKDCEILGCNINIASERQVSLWMKVAPGREQR